MNQAFQGTSIESLNQQNRAFAAQALVNHTLLYPNEYVVRFLASLPHRPDGMTPLKEGLDIGFGSGQHLKLLMDYGYRAHGIELVPEAGDRITQLFDHHPLLGTLTIDDFRQAELPVAFYDVLIAWGVLFLRPLPEMLKDLQRMRSLLKPDGHLCLNFRTPENWFYGLGDRLEDEHFLLDERAKSYAGAHYTFVDEPTTRMLMTNAGFSIRNFERWDWWKTNQQEHHSWWIVWATPE